MTLWLQYAIFGAVAGAYFLNKPVFWKHFILSLPIMPGALFGIAPSPADANTVIVLLLGPAIGTFALFQRGARLAQDQINDNDHTNIEEVF